MDPQVINNIVFNLAACGVLFAVGAYTVGEAIHQRIVRRKWSLGLVGAIVLGGVMSMAMVGYGLLFIFVLAGSVES